MKQRLVGMLACPDCGADLDLSVQQESDGEILEGSLRCLGCGTPYPIRGGVPRFAEVTNTGHKETAAAFGYQWKHFAALNERYRKQFLDWIRPVEPSFFKGKAVLEGGCGKGRHTALAADFGATDVVAMDLSEAVDVAFANTGRHPSVHIVQADLNHPPVKRVFDYAFSIGVLHHLPDPERGFRALTEKVKPGGAMSAWVYGREGNGWIVRVVSPLRERITSRLPRPVLQPLAALLTAPMFVATRFVYRPAGRTALAGKLPYASYLEYIADFSFREQRTIVFDHLVPPIAHYLRRDEFAAWFDRASLADVVIEHHNANSWRGFGRVPAGA